MDPVRPLTTDGGVRSPDDHACTSEGTISDSSRKRWNPPVAPDPVAFRTARNTGSISSDATGESTTRAICRAPVRQRPCNAACNSVATHSRLTLLASRRQMNVSHRPRCAESTTSAGCRQLFLPVQGQQGMSPTTWRHSVVVVGRLVAAKDVSAGAPAGAEAPAEIRGRLLRERADRSGGTRVMSWGLRADGPPSRGVSRARCGSWGPQTPAAPNGGRGDRWPRPWPSDRGRSDPTARRSSYW